MLYILYVSPLLCNVDVMISTLQKRLQDALLSLVEPSSSFRIGSHLGRDIWSLSRSLSFLRCREPANRSHHTKTEQESGRRRKQEEMDWKGTRGAVLIAGEGQPSASTITGNHDMICMQGLVQSARSPRRRGEAETPMSNQPPRGAQGRRLLGPAALRPCPFASQHGQVHARLEPGGYCRCSGNGGPQTCLPAACGVAQTGAQRGPSSSTQD